MSPSLDEGLLEQRVHAPHHAGPDERLAVAQGAQQPRHEVLHLPPHVRAHRSAEVLGDLHGLGGYSVLS